MAGDRGDGTATNASKNSLNPGRAPEERQSTEQSSTVLRVQELPSGVLKILAI